MIMKILETERLYCRPFEDTKKDLKLLVKLHKDDRVTKYLPNFDTKRYLKSQLEGQRDYGISKWAVFLKENDEFIGRAGLTRYSKDKKGNYIKDKSKHKTALGFALLPEYWNKGYTTEVGKAICDWAFKNVSDLTKIESGTEESNIASQKVLKKLGFKFVKKGEFMGLKTKEYILKK